MEENFNETYNYLRSAIEEELYPNTEKNIETENNKNDEQKNANEYINNGHYAQTATNINNINNHIYNINNTNNINNLNYNNYNFNNYNTFNNFKNLIGENINFMYNNIQFNREKHNNLNIFYQNEPIQSDKNKYSNNKNNETCLNVGEEGVEVNSHKYMNEINKKTSNSSNNTANLNGKQINTINEAINGALMDLFNSNDINLESKKDMQLLKKKKKRRTKKEVALEKQLKLNEVKIKKKLGRKKGIVQFVKSNEHTKYNDDNIIKKINSFFLESIRNWLNNSFIDENGNFQTAKSRIKLKKELFLKINPKLITTNLKKEVVMNIMNDKFKNIFANQVSTKYRKVEKNQNSKLIEKINDKNQPFVAFILESTFIDIFNYFNGQSKEEEFKRYFLELKYDEKLVDEFFDGFDKIKKFLEVVKNKEEKRKQSKLLIQEYIQRISLLCLNYKEFFDKKFNRSENKCKKEKEINEEKNNNINI